MNQVFVPNQFPLRRLENVTSLEQGYPTADNYSGVGVKLLRQVGVIKPDHPDIARLVADNSLGAAPATQVDLLSLPHVGDYGLLFPLGKL
jgi:hypothetical protein